MLTIRQAADLKGLTPGRIHQLIRANKIKASRFGGMWMIQEKDLEQAVWNRIPGKKEDSTSII